MFDVLIYCVLLLSVYFVVQPIAKQYFRKEDTIKKDYKEITDKEVNTLCRVICYTPLVILVLIVIFSM